LKEYAILKKKKSFGIVKNSSKQSIKDKINLMKTFSRNKQKERKIKIKCINKQYRKREDSYCNRKKRSKNIIQRKGSASLRSRINKENINPTKSNKTKKKYNLTDYFSKANS